MMSLQHPLLTELDVLLIIKEKCLKSPVYYHRLGMEGLIWS